MELAFNKLTKQYKDKTAVNSLHRNAYAWYLWPAGCKRRRKNHADAHDMRHLSTHFR